MGTRWEATISAPARASCSASASRPASVRANTWLTRCMAGWAMASSSPSAAWSAKPASAAFTASAVRPVTASAGAPAMARTTRVRRLLPAMRPSTASARSGWPENIKMAASSAMSSSVSGREVMTARAAALTASAASGWHKPQWAFLALVTARRSATCSLHGSPCPSARTRSAASKTPSSYSASPSSSAPAASSCSPGTASISRRTTRKSCA